MNVGPSNQSTTFGNVPEFINYFKTHEELPLAAEQPLIVNDTSMLFDYSDRYERRSLKLLKNSGNLIEKIVFIFDRMLLPLAKTMRIRLGADEKNAEVTSELFFSKQVFAVTFSTDVILKPAKSHLYTQITDLMRLMVASSTFEVKLEPEQFLTVTNLTSEESNKMLESEEKAYSVPTTRNPHLGFNLSCRVEVPVYEVVTANGTDSSCFRMKGKEFQLSLKPNNEFNRWDFCQRLQLTSEIKVESRFELHDSAIPRLIKLYEDSYAEVDLALPEFILSQMVLSTGKCVTLDSKDEINCELNNNQFIIESSAPFTITLVTAPLFVTISALKDALIHHHTDELSLQANQELIIIDVDPTEIKPWLASNVESEGATLALDFAHYLEKYNPLGYIWTSSFGGNLQIFLDENKNFFELHVKGTEYLTLSLQRASGVNFLLTLLEQCHPKVTEDILDHTEAAFIYILFRTMCFFCCEDARLYDNVDALPEYFQESVSNKFLELLDSENKFQKHLDKVHEGTDLEILRGLVYLTPEEFDGYSVSDLSESLSYVITTLRGLASEELQGESVFVRNNLKKAIEIIAEKKELQEKEK